MKTYGVSKVNKKSNLEKLLLELLNTDEQLKTPDAGKDIQTTEEESKGPSIVLQPPKEETEHQMSDEEMASYLEGGNIDTSSQGVATGLEEVNIGLNEIENTYSIKM